MSEADRKVWQRAIDHYASVWAGQDLLFDSGLTKIKLLLAKHEDDAVLSDGELPTTLQAVLNEASAVYRRSVWPQHDAANREWVAAHIDDLKKFGPAPQQRRVHLP